MTALRVLIGCGGGIAAFKVAALASRLVQRGHQVWVAMTPAAREFVGAATFEGLTHRKVVVRTTQVDADGSAPHLAAPAWAQVLVVAPATADLLARLAAGAGDDPVCLGALSMTGRRALCPTMTDTMWRSAAVQRNVAALAAAGWSVLGPVEGMLAEGYAAVGRMVEPDDIVAWIEGAAAP